MELPLLRKGRLYFDTAMRPAHVTFDDGKRERRNLPWLHYVETRWAYDEPDALKILIGEWLVVIMGNHLGPLFLAIEEHSLARIRAQPDLGGKPEHEVDTFASAILFFSAPSPQKKQKSQLELDLGTEKFGSR